jgi:hypothetical protein
MLNLKSALLVPLTFVVIAVGAQSATIPLRAIINMAQESGPNTPADPSKGPPVTSVGDPRPAAFGIADFILDTTANTLMMTAVITNIDVTGSQTAGDTNDNLLAAHIHAGPMFSAAGTLPVAWGFFGSPFNDLLPPVTTVTPASGVGGSFHGTWNAPEGNNTTLVAQIPNILAGRSYINFHTGQYPGGEIRGLIQVVPEPSTYAFMAIGSLALATFGSVRRRRGLANSSDFGTQGSGH